MRLLSASSFYVLESRALDLRKYAYLKISWYPDRKDCRFPTWSKSSTWCGQLSPIDRRLNLSWEFIYQVMSQIINQQDFYCYLVVSSINLTGKRNTGVSGGQVTSFPRRLLLLITIVHNEPSWVNFASMLFRISVVW